jgi:hypothetical protein
VHNLPFNTINIFGDDLKALEDTCGALQNKFGICATGDFDVDIKQFDCAHCDMNVELNSETLVNGCYLALMDVTYRSGMYRSSGGSGQYYGGKQLWAFVKLKKDFGRILIRHETLTDKIVELIHPIELDFADDKHFSEKFYVVTNDKDKALLAMNWNFRNAVMDMHADWMVEIVNNHLLVYNNRTINAEETVQLVEFAGKIASLR